MKMTVIAAAAIALAGSFGSAIAAGDAAAGKAKFAVCAGCHGPTGAGNEALKYPKLAGLDAATAAQQLRDFKSGKRTTPMAATMKAMTAGLSDADIDNLAAYIATLK
jgi:cytochrome c553